ncbi:MAG TPA: ROK family transcriptional regulator [Trueperaceae bacterium]|nr:ROK family transcriptional regulator [Trueperaceae bacterium]
MKDLNHKAVLELLARQGSLSRVEISARLTLSQASVSRIIESLSAAHLVREEGTVSSRPGRPQVLIGLDPSAGTVVAVDLRPWSLRIWLADLLGELKAEEEFEPDRDASPDHQADQLVTQILDLSVDCTGAGDLVAIAIGVAAAWDAGKGRIYAARNQGSLEGVDFVALVKRSWAERQVGNCAGPAQLAAVLVDNDVNLAACAEAVAGAALDSDDFFYLSLGSGVGGAAIVAGELYTGVTGFAGEVGYLPLRDRTGQLVDLEGRISILALDASLRRIGSAATACDFVSRPPNGDDEERLLDEFAEDVAIAIAAVVATFNPSLVVLAGTLGRCCGPVLGRIDALLATLLPIPPKIVISQVGRDAALIGGLSLALASARTSLLLNRLGGAVARSA